MARNNIKIKTTLELDIPDGFICSGKHDCSALTKTDEPNDNVRICANFNHYVWWSDNGGYFQKCRPCVEATMKYLAERSNGNG